MIDFKESKGYHLNKSNMDLSFGFDGTVLVIENPTKTYFDALYTISKELRGLATLEDIYFWQADECTHDSMKKELSKQLGITIKDPFCGLYYKNNKLYVDGYQYLNGDLNKDPNEDFAKDILLQNKYALRLFSKDEIKNAKNHHLS